MIALKNSSELWRNVWSQLPLELLKYAGRIGASLAPILLSSLKRLDMRIWKLVYISKVPIAVQIAPSHHSSGCKQAKIVRTNFEVHVCTQLRQNQTNKCITESTLHPKIYRVKISTAISFKHRIRTVQTGKVEIKIIIFGSLGQVLTWA